MNLKYEQMREKLLKENALALKDIEEAIKVAVYISIINVESFENKTELLQKEIIKYFSLDIFNEDDVELIFDKVIDNQGIDDLFKLTIKDIQTYYLSYLTNLDDIDTAYMLIELLEQITIVKGKKCTDEETIIKNTFQALIYNYENHDIYENILQKIDNHHSQYVFSRNGLKPEKFQKKVSKAINSYAKGLKEKDIISLYDNTIFGGADKGFVITKLAILTTLDEDISVIPLSMIYKVTYDKKGMTFFSIDNYNNYVEIAYLPRYDNIRILSNILNQIGTINIEEDKKEGVAL